MAAKGSIISGTAGSSGGPCCSLRPGSPLNPLKDLDCSIQQHLSIPAHDINLHLISLVNVGAMQKLQACMTEPMPQVKVAMAHL